MSVTALKTGQDFSAMLYLLAWLLFSTHVILLMILNGGFYAQKN